MMPERGLGWSAVGRSAEIQPTTPNLTLDATFVTSFTVPHSCGRSSGSPR